jgi:hypothetical protein
MKVEVERLLRHSEELWSSLGPNQILPCHDTIPGHLYLLSSSPSLSTPPPLSTSYLSPRIIYEDLHLSLSLSYHNISFPSAHLIHPPSYPSLSSSDTSFPSYSIIVSHNSQQIFLTMKSPVEYLQFLEGWKLFSDIQNLVLDLNIFYRDLFFHGFLKQSSIENLNVNDLNKNLLECSKPIVLPEAPSQTPSAIPTNSFTSPTNHSQDVALQFQKAKCIYCETPVTITTNRNDFKVHPYVPIDNLLNVVYLCVPCHNNYTTFRKDAVAQELLVLPGEVNEEICACCSDSPTFLILCSTCPRSFCDPCLLRLLSQNGYTQMKSQSNWKCMCCVLSNEQLFKISNLLSLPLPWNGGVSHPKIKGAASKPFTDLGKRNVDGSSSTPVTPRLPPTTPKTASGKVTLSAQNISTSIPKIPSGKPPATPKSTPGKITPGSTLVSNNNKNNNNNSSSSPCTLLSQSYAPQDSPVSQHLPMPGYQEIASKQTPMIARTSRSEVGSKAKRQRISSSLISESAAAQRSSIGHPRRGDTTRITPAQVPALPVNPAFDEVYYFSQYAEYLDRQSSPTTPECQQEPTEDFCFLCKDGGDLIECDYRRKSCRQHCRKVYHSYCLGFGLEDDGTEWKCMRHYCALCGAYNPIVSCWYCPNSYCESCFVNHNTQSYGILKRSKIQAITRPDQVAGKGKSPKTAKIVGALFDKVDILCGSCLLMIDRCKGRHMWNESGEHPEYTLHHVKGRKK